MNGVSGPVSGQQNLSVARQGLQILQAGEQSHQKATGKTATSRSIAEIAGADPRSANWRSPLSVLNDVTAEIMASGKSGVQESYSPGGHGFFSPGHLVLNDSDAELNFARSILAQVNGDGVTLNVARHAMLQVNGQNSTVNVGGVVGAQINGDYSTLNVGGALNGQINGDGSTVNVASDADLQINGDNAEVNVAGILEAQINGDNATVKAKEAFRLQINGDNATLNVQTLHEYTMLNGENLTVNADVALGNVRFGSHTYFDTVYGREHTEGNGSGDIKLNIGTVEGYAATGDGNDVLTIGTAIGVSAGQGDDVIRVDNAMSVYGGKGDDQIEVGEGVEQVDFDRGDGHDIVTAHGGTTIELRGIRKDQVRISAEDGTYRISFEGSDDTIELRTLDGATSKLTFSSRSEGAIELKDGKVTYL